MKFAVKDKSIDLEKKCLELFIYTWDNNPIVNYNIYNFYILIYY